MRFWKFRKRHANNDSRPHPLDPHGDGTIRPGDAIFDAMMRGETVVGNLREDGSWELTHFKDDGK